MALEKPREANKKVRKQQTKEAELMNTDDTYFLPYQERWITEGALWERFISSLFPPLPVGSLNSWLRPHSMSSFLACNLCRIRYNIGM